MTLGKTLFSLQEGSPMLTKSGVKLEKDLLDSKARIQKSNGESGSGCVCEGKTPESDLTQPFSAREFKELAWWEHGLVLVRRAIA